MNRINQFELEPGPYCEGDFVVIVLDVITHQWNREKQLQEALDEPLVMCRDLLITEHKRYLYPLLVFRAKFQPC